jgi:hypothetical protein
MSDSLDITSKHTQAMPVVAPPLPDEPYRGVEPFRFVDYQIFSARGEETWTLFSNVTLYRAVLLYGASGTGKSSLINAGLLPLVLKENLVPDRLRVQPLAGREIKVERLKMSGSEQETVHLPSNFAADQSDASSESIELSLAAFRSRIEEFRPPETEGTVHRASDAPRPLLIFDQFEEFVTLFEEARRVGASAGQVPSAQQEILATLVELIQDDTLPVKIIFAFREDYLAKLSLLFDHCPELLDQAQRLVPPGIEVLPQIIRAPFANPLLREHFLKQRDGAGSELSESLAQRISDELARRSEHGNVNLTELQIVCQRLWQAADPEKLFAKDGIEGLLKDYGSDVFRHLTQDLRDAAVVLLSHMVTASNTRNIISEEDLLQRTTDCDLDPSQCSAALAALARSQMVRREPRHNIYFYEITSEYLVPWIKERVAERKSAEARRLAEEERRKAEAERAEAIREFEAERQRSRIFQRVLAAASIFLAIAVVLGVVAYVQYQRAKEAKDKATEAQQQTQEILTALTLLTSKDPEDNLKGIENFNMLVKENKIPSDLASVVIQPVFASQDKRVHQAGYNFLLQVEQTNPDIAQSVSKAAQTNDALAEKIPPRFYIHIADESQRPQAQRMAAFLKKKGYLVPGIENVGDKGVRNNQLRYFRDSEPGIPTPQELIAFLNSAGLGNWIPNRVRGYEQSQKVVVGQFELWFASELAPTQTPTPTPSAENSGVGTLSIIITRTEAYEVGEANPSVKVVIRDDNGQITSSQNVINKMGYTLKPGYYSVSVDARGYEPEIRRVTITAGQDTSVTFKLKKKKPAAPRP